ncbi:MAG: hypothetical protein KY053_01515 [Candidatus Liptonbacteria bacterium]|nr:hypothetical protein [Candidatus Liptonbacteria bacterium]
MKSIIPVVNCSDFKCVKKNIELAVEFLPKGGWVHIDISDGKFTKNLTWNNPGELKKMIQKNKNLGKINFEVNLMVLKPEGLIEKWLKVGVKRIIINIEILKNPDFFLKICGKYKAQAMISISSKTSVQKFIKNYSRFFDGQKIMYFHLLAVTPGFSGQTFQRKILKKIKILRKNFPRAIIEVDGGINPNTLKLAKKAGADLFAASSYIFNNSFPKKAYRDLCRAAEIN